MRSNLQSWLCNPATKFTLTVGISALDHQSCAACRPTLPSGLSEDVFFGKTEFNEVQLFSCCTWLLIGPTAWPSSEQLLQPRFSSLCCSFMAQGRQPIDMGMAAQLRSSQHSLGSPRILAPLPHHASKTFPDCMVCRYMEMTLSGRNGTCGSASTTEKAWCCTMLGKPCH